MKIHELAEQTGLTADTIRYYEKEGLLDHQHVSRSQNNYRTYTDEAIERLRLIKKLQSVGFSLAELRENLKESPDDPATNQRVIEHLRVKIDEFKQKMAEYDHILETLNWMLEYRIAMGSNPEKAETIMRRVRKLVAERTAKADEPPPCLRRMTGDSELRIYGVGQVGYPSDNLRPH